MSMEKQMIKFINIARQNPSYFVPILEKQISSFVNDREMPLTEQVIYETNEGKQAWVQALSFLRKQKPIDKLQEHEGLNCSAKDHAQDLSKNNIFGHTGSDGSTFSERILKYCRKGSGSMAELIGADFNYNNRNHAEMTVLGLIIDDGVPDRGHRKTIFNPLYKHVGCKSQIQGQKIITVFNITENKLALRSGSNLEPPAMTSTANSLNRKTAEEKMSYTASLKPYKTQNEDKFSKTEWLPQNSYEKMAKQQRPVDKMMSQMGWAEHSNRFGGTIPIKSSVSGNSSTLRKLKQKKQSSKIYYEQGSKVTEVTTKLVYTDGTVQEKTEKHTVYLES